MIGIATIFRTGNYGGSLQAYALKKAIELNGLGEAEIINYCCDSVKGKIDMKFLRNAGLFHTAVAIVEKIYYFPRMKKVMSFVDSYSGPAKEELKKDQLAALNDKYDIFLSGSDQIWNPEIQQGDYYYLLDFVKDPDKKRSYASSFGAKKIDEKYHETYKKLLSEYKYIAVREEEGAGLVEEFTGKRPKVVLDPVLLLDKEQWASMLPERKFKGKYVFVYQMAHSPLIANITSKCAKELGAKVKFVPFPIAGFCKCSIQLGLSSLEWVRGIMDSEFVITDSFHASVFSILFHKQFYYVVTSETIKKRISRISTLLKRLGMQNRIVYSIDECNFSDIIDYDHVQQQLDEARAESLAELTKAVKG